jgi:hypothetical protein
MHDPIPCEAPLCMPIGQFFGVAADAVMDVATFDTASSKLTHTVERYPARLGPAERMPDDDAVRAYFLSMDKCREIF